MKILFLASTYPHPSYPFSAFIKVICEEMVRQGNEVVVIAPQSFTSTLLGRKVPLPKDVSYEVEKCGNDIPIRVLRPYSLTFGRFRKFTCRAKRHVAYRTYKHIGFSPDIIYAHFWNNAYNALDIIKNSGKPLFVATGEDRIIIDKIFGPCEIAHIRESVRGTICVSTKNKIESIEKGLTAEEKCIVLPNATNQDLFFQKSKKECRKKLGFPEDAYIVAFSGRFIERKGIKRVSDAIKMCNDKNIKSIFIGQIVDGNEIHPDCEGVLFEGALEHSIMPDYLNAADVFVLPSLAEGCSNAIIEAMACGLPIISSALPFNDDICSNDNSILVDPMNVKAIAESIMKLKDRELRKTLSSGALRTAKKLSISERTSKILTFINDNKE